MTESERIRSLAHIEAEILVNQARTDVEGSTHNVFDLIKYRLGEMLFECGAVKWHYPDEVVKDMADRLAGDEQQEPDRWSRTSA